MLRLLANRNKKKIIVTKKEEEKINDFEFFNKNPELKNLELKDYNLHLFINNNLKISSIDELLPEFLSPFLDNQKNTNLRIYLINSEIDLSKVINNSIFYWKKVSDNIVTSKKIDLVKINLDDDKKKNFFIEYEEKMQDKNMILFFYNKDNKINQELNHNLKHQSYAFDSFDYQNIVLEFIDEKFSIFNPLKYEPNKIKSNFCYYTLKKQEIVKKFFAKKINELIFILYPVYFNLKESNEIENFENISLILNNKITIESINNYWSSEIFKLSKFFNLNSNEVDTFVGSFMEALDNINLLESFVNEKLNPLLISHYNYFYLLNIENLPINENIKYIENKEECYDSTSSYYTSEED